MTERPELSRLGERNQGRCIECGEIVF